MPVPERVANSLIPGKAIGVFVAERLRTIKETDISTDTELAEAALLLHVKQVEGVEIEGNKMFMVCRECKEHRVCKKQMNNASLSTKCSVKKCVKNWQEKRQNNHYVRGKNFCKKQHKTNSPPRT